MNSTPPSTTRVELTAGVPEVSSVFLYLANARVFGAAGRLNFGIKGTDSEPLLYFKIIPTVGRSRLIRNIPRI